MGRWRCTTGWLAFSSGTTRGDHYQQSYRPILSRSGDQKLPRCKTWVWHPVWHHYDRTPGRHCALTDHHCFTLHDHPPNTNRPSTKRSIIKWRYQVSTFGPLHDTGMMQTRKGTREEFLKDGKCSDMRRCDRYSDE